MPAGVATVVAALADALHTAPGRPLVTFYDGATGERVELSVKTFDNWVCKIANLLGDELMLATGDTVRVDLPTHWQSTVTLLAAWTAGLRVSLDGRSASHAAASVVGPAALRDPSAVAGQAIACSLRPLGRPFPEELPAGWLDFGRDIPSQPDVLLVPPSITPPDVALDAEPVPVTHQQLVERAVGTASELELRGGGRIITDANPASETGVAVALLAPLVAGSSVVLVTNCDATARSAIAAQERATASCWLTG